MTPERLRNKRRKFWKQTLERVGQKSSLGKQVTRVWVASECAWAREDSPPIKNPVWPPLGEANE